MRWHLRLMLLCTIAAFAAGCSNSDKPSDSSSITNPNFAEDECGGSISDRVWYDTNCNGLQDAGEPGAPGVTVKLFLCADDSQVGERVTDANGNYSFGGFLPNNYYVTFTAPAGYEFSPNLVGDNRLLDSDPDASGKVACFALECDKNIRSVDAGLCEGEEECDSSVGDRVWFDVNCNGIQDKDEPNAPAGLTLTLYTCEGAKVDETTTGANGGYLFDGLEAGSYKICLTVPEGYEITLKDQGANDGLDSDGGANGCTDCFELGECTDRTDKDFGLCEKKGEGGEGCTPGFWRNHLIHWGPTGYTPDMIVNDVFGCELVPAGVTLGQAIDAPQTYGALVFHAIAALLNEAHPDVDYDWSESEIITKACAGDKDSLADSNEDGCTLSGGNTTGGGGSSKRTK